MKDKEQINRNHDEDRTSTSLPPSERRFPVDPPSKPDRSEPPSKGVNIKLEVRPPQPPSSEPASSQATQSSSQSTNSRNPNTEKPVIPARMLNEFVYCPRLFYYEFVEGLFLANADTERGKSIHAKVDSGKGDLPDPKTVNKVTDSDEQGATEPGSKKKSKPKTDVAPEIIHSRSVQMGSERLGVIAKMDLVEARPAVDDGSQPDLFSRLEVCPVDYKAGSPKKGEDVNEIWDADKMQLGLQALILRDNGYVCKAGIIYYRGTKQRVRLPITPDLEDWVLKGIQRARKTMVEPIPPPLVDSPKCVRCSLAPVCLPDETHFLKNTNPADLNPTLAIPKPDDSPRRNSTPFSPRRLIAARDDKRVLYLNTQGYRAGCSGEVIQVKSRDKLIDEVRIRDVSHVALFGNIQISTQAIQILCKLEIPVTYFSMGGWFYGLTRGHGLKNVFLRMEQFRLANDPVVCLSLARQFVHGKIRNQRAMLMRNHLEPPEPILLKMKRASEDALTAPSIESLLGVEGAAAALYFQAFNGMIKVNDSLDLLGDSTRPAPNQQLSFNFQNRNRRPPTDPVNAMLSLGYSVLAKDCMLATLAVGFDPYLGFYHQPRFGRPALGLDLMEEFRPLIAESTVLNCINNRIITEKDFVRAGQAVNLTPDGRKKFFQSYEKRMSSLITHPVFDYKVSYRRTLELQARLLAKCLIGEIDRYIPMKTR